MLLSAAPSGLYKSIVHTGGSATLHPRLCSSAASRLRIRQQAPKGRQSITPHTKSTKFTKFLSREAATDTPASPEGAIRIQTGVERSVTPGTDKTKTSPEGAADYRRGRSAAEPPGGRICSLCTLILERNTLIPDFWIPRNDLQFAVVAPHP